MKGGWIIPAGSFLEKKKAYAYLWKLFNDVRTITGCFILAEGYFSFWLRVISTILPLFHSPLKPSPPPTPPTAFLRAGILVLSLPKKDQTWTLSLKSWRASTLDHPSSLFFLSPLYPSMDIFILRMLDVWATACWKWYFHCPPVVEMDFE